MNTERKVAVVGSGAVGSMSLWALAKRSPSVLDAFDAYAPGHDRGGYGGQSRIFRLAYQEGSEYVPMLLQAKQLWRELEEASNQSLLTETGGLSIGPRNQHQMDSVHQSIQQFDLAHTYLDQTEAARRFPHLPLTGDETAVLDHGAGVLRPEQAVIAANQQAENLGATLHRYSPITALTADSGGVTVATPTGEKFYDHVILSPGPWSREFLELSHLPLQIHEITSMWFLARDPQQFAPMNSPIVIRSGTHAFSCFPSIDGETVKVSQNSVPRPLVDSAEKVDRNPPQRIFDALRQAVRTHLPTLHPDPVRTGTYADCFTPDQHGIIGTLPSLPNITIMTGFSGHGFKLSPTFGEIAADLALTGHTDHAIHHLSPSRFTRGGEKK